MRRGMRGLLAALLWLLAAAPAGAEEAILRFLSEVEVRADASLLVTETITVRSEGRAIRRGIYRDFPLRFRYDDGSTGKVGFSVVRVLRDGKPEKWFRKDMKGHARIYIGRRDVFIPRGEHTFVLTYRTTRQIRFFRDFDELYWNVTGNFWRFPILKAKVSVRLPKAAPILSAALYTGAYGARGGHAARVLRRENGRFAAETTAPLAPREGFTIAISFPKGVVREPGAAEKALRRFLDGIGLWWLLGGSAAVAGYFLWIWRKVGRDPPRGAIYPRWEPPMGLSPAATAWLAGEASAFGMDVKRAFIAALVSLATRGVIRIEKAGGRTEILRLKAPPANLPPGERAIMDHLLIGRRTRLDKATGRRLAKTLSALKSALAAEYEHVFVERNRKWFFIGLGLAVAVIAGFFLLSGGGNDAIVGFLVTAVFLGIFIFMAWTILRNIRRTRGWGKVGLIFFLLVWGLPFAIFLPAQLLFMAAGSGLSRHDILVLPALLLPPVLVVVFWFLLPRPTERGRQALDELEGLKMFIKTAEKERLNMAGAPKMSISTFERLLPYAIALGLEEPWTKAFRAWLATAAGAAAASYHPAWYGGRSFGAEEVGNIGSGLVSSISSDMAAAMPRQSSSGSSGGGFSGGGGGGGGGGGW